MNMGKFNFLSQFNCNRLIYTYIFYISHEHGGLLQYGHISILLCADYVNFTHLWYNECIVGFFHDLERYLLLSSQRGFQTHFHYFSVKFKLQVLDIWIIFHYKIGLFLIFICCVC